MLYNCNASEFMPRFMGFIRYCVVKLISTFVVQSYAFQVVFRFDMTKFMVLVQKLQDKCN